MEFSHLLLLQILNFLQFSTNFDILKIFSHTSLKFRYNSFSALLTSEKKSFCWSDCPVYFSVLKIVAAEHSGSPGSAPSNGCGPRVTPHLQAFFFQPQLLTLRSTLATGLLGPRGLVFTEVRRRSASNTLGL